MYKRQDEPCIADEGCERRDAAGVRHFLYGDGADDLRVMIKTVEASEFEGRPIGALDIGTARDPVSYTHLDVYKRQLWKSVDISEKDRCRAGDPSNRRAPCQIVGPLSKAARHD